MTTNALAPIGTVTPQLEAGSGRVLELACWREEYEWIAGLSFSIGLKKKNHFRRSGLYI
ncbi:hypothetical protein [Chryseobacterium pyrolae]|nr:hypothetical protein [Chryseobacterium pyrolae]